MMWRSVQAMSTLSIICTARGRLFEERTLQVAFLPLDGKILLQDGGHGSRLVLRGVGKCLSAGARGLARRVDRIDLVGHAASVTNKHGDFMRWLRSGTSMRERHGRRIVNGCVRWELQLCQSFDYLWRRVSIFIGQVLKLAWHISMLILVFYFLIFIKSLG